MEKNKTGKYLKYAIGEIILVVFGILIALWINSTYNDYKNRQLETVYLADFKRDLVADTVKLGERIKKNEVMIQSIDSIFTYFEKNELSGKELFDYSNHHWQITGESYFIPEKGTIRQLESSNSANLISSKSFKAKLFEYHTINDRDEKNMETSIQLYQHNFYTRDFTKAMMIEEVFMLWRGEQSSLNQEGFTKIKMNKGYRASLIGKKIGTANQNKHYLIVKTIAKELIKQIDSELE
jgi:hypothetical protein